MKEEFMRLLNETFSDLHTVEGGKLRELVNCTALWFNDIQVKIASQDEKTLQEAQQDLTRAKALLEKHVERVMAASGMTPEEFAQLGEGPTLSETDETSLLSEVKKTMAPFVKPSVRQKGAVRKKKTRLLG